MNKEEREDYIFQKKCLLILLFIFYISDVSYDSVTLRSFGFHFDPSCNFKAIVTSKKEHFHKYTVHIFPTLFGINLQTLDVMGNVNMLKVKKVRESELYEPSASINVYFDDNEFIATGFVEGQKIEYCTTKQDQGNYQSELIYRLNDDASTKGKNTSAESFLLWLLKLYTTRLPTDLVMGAGINQDYGAKNWSELLSALNTDFYQGDQKSADEVKHYVGKELFTSSMILKTSGFDTYKSLCHELYEFKEAKSFNDCDSTLYKCVDFIQAHPGVSIITYNYDTNLEYLLKKRSLRYTTIYDDNSFVTKDSICDIYHVHGLLPYDRYDQKKFTDSLIFNESDYYYLYNNPYSWNIAKQLHDFKFHSCLFIGISLTDPDMKRLLELASNYMKFNFIFVKKEDGYSASVYKDITAYFFSFDLITIWVDKYEDIGEWLKKI
jgi:hypothetical protein